MEFIKYENYIYFIGTFKKGKEITLKYNECILQPYQINEIQDKDKTTYEVKIFRIDKNNFEFKEEIETLKFKIILEDKEEGEFKASIERRIKKYGFTFLFNTNFVRKTFFIDKYPSAQYLLSNKEQYEFYRNIIDMKDKYHKSDLVWSAAYMIEKAEQYEMSFFVTVFSDIIYIKELYIYSQIFNIKKISSLGIVNKNDLMHAQSLINLNFANPEEDMIRTEDIEEKERNLKKMAIFLFYFNYHYQKDKIIDLLNNEHYNKYIYQKLIERKKELLGINLQKNCMNKLISFAKDYDELAIIISYSKDVLEVLEIINENRNIFIEKLKIIMKENKNDDNKINKTIYINKDIIKESDNIEKIKVQIEKILSIENELNINFIVFPIDFFEKYVAKYNNENENNINNLIKLMEVIKLIKQNKKSILNYNNILIKIHEILIKFATEGKIQGLSLLKFIKNEEYIPYENNANNKVNDIENEDKGNYFANIFKGININQVNDEFIKIWKEIKWLKIFNNKEKQFYSIVCNIIKNMKDFGKLFSLFDIYDKENDYNEECLLAMKDKFIALLNTISKNELPNFIEDSSNLIYYLNKRNLPLNDLITNLNMKKIIEIDGIHSIFYKIYSNDKFNVFNDELTNRIIEFYKMNKIFVNPLYLIFYIKNIKEELKNNEDLSQISEYNIRENEIFNLEESVEFKLLRTIIDNNLKDNPTIIEYIQLASSIILFDIQDILNGDVRYIDINKFYFNNKQNELFERIKLVSCLIEDEDLKKKTNDCKEIIEMNMNNINKIIKDLEEIKKKIEMFYPNSKKDDIRKIDSILNNIRKQSLFYYQKIKGDIDCYLNKEDFNNLNSDMKKGNVFFKILYEEKREKFKDDDELIMKETEKDMNNLINIIKGNSLKNTNINNLCQLLTKLNKEEKNNLGKEIDKLIDQYKLNVILDKDKLVKDLLLISKKNIIYNCAEDFLSLIDLTKVEQEEFTQINKTIVKYLKNPTDINVIEFSIELLKNYDIQFEEESNYCYLKLLDMIKNKNDIIELLINTTLQKCKDLIDFFEKNGFEKGDITSLIECKTFFDNFANNKTKDKDIVKSFIDEMSKSKNIEIEFNKFINSYDVIISMLPMVE